MLGSITTVSTILAVLPGSRGKSGFNNPSSKAAARKTQPGSIFYPINYTEVLLKRNIFEEKVQSSTLNVPLFFFKSARSNFTLRAVVPMQWHSLALPALTESLIQIIRDGGQIHLFWKHILTPEILQPPGVTQPFLKS